MLIFVPNLQTVLCWFCWV